MLLAAHLLYFIHSSTHPVLFRHLFGILPKEKEIRLKPRPADPKWTGDLHVFAPLGGFPGSGFARGVLPVDLMMGWHCFCCIDGVPQEENPRLARYGSGMEIETQYLLLGCGL